MGKNRWIKKISKNKSSTTSDQNSLSKQNSTSDERSPSKKRRGFRVKSGVRSPFSSPRRPNKYSGRKPSSRTSSSIASNTSDADQEEITLTDLKCIRENEDRIVLRLIEDEWKGSEFDDMIKQLVYISTIAGAEFQDIKSTYRDSTHAFIVLTIKGKMKLHSVDVDCTTSFLIKKEDLYLIGFCLHKREMDEHCWKKAKNWKMCSGSRVSLRNSSSANFGVNYCESRSSLTKGEREKCNKGYFGCHGCVGIKALMYHMYMLHQETLTAHSFHSICVHIAESTRFRSISEIVKFGKHEIIEQIHYALMDNWSALSNCHRERVLYGELSDKNIKKLDDCKISADKIGHCLRIMLRERDDYRTSRRLKDQISNKVTHRKTDDFYFMKKTSILTPKTGKREWNKLVEQKSQKQENGRIVESWKGLRRLMGMKDAHLFRMLYEHLDLVIISKRDLSIFRDDFNITYEIPTKLRTYKMHTRND